jgi:hypothetical protein
VIAVNYGYDNVSSANRCLIIVRVIEEGSNGPGSVLISEEKTSGLSTTKLDTFGLALVCYLSNKPPTLTITLLERKSLFFVRA